MNFVSAINKTLRFEVQFEGCYCIVFEVFAFSFELKSKIYNDTIFSCF